MKIAITGGAGFIGTELARLLKDHGHTVVLLDLKKSETFPLASHAVDICDRESVLRALNGAEVIYHLAAEHRDDVRPAQRYYDVNVTGTENIIAAAEHHNIRTIIFTSTVALYGLDCGHSRESDTPAPFNDYGVSKLEAEKRLALWAASHPARKLVTMRLVATFGPGNRGNIFTLMDQIARGKFIMVGRGENRKSIAYVGNVAAFLVHALALPVGAHLYNYADKPDLTMRELVGDIRAAFGMGGSGPAIPYVLGLLGGMVFDMAARLSGRVFPVSAIRVRKFCADTVVSAEKLKSTGFEAPYSLPGGLREMIEKDFLTK
jgi:nucleoside-diphosphate-sugar epimerase